MSASGITLRAPGPDDAERIDDLFNRISLAQYGTADSTVEQVEQWLGISTIDLERDVVLAEAPDGALVAYGDLYDDGQKHTRLWLDVREDPALEGRGAGGMVLAALESRAAELASQAEIPEEPLLRAYVPAVAESIGRLLQGRGYRLIRHSFRMAIDLGGPQPEPSWPDGVSVRTFDRTADEQRVFDVQNETFADMWEYHPEPLEDWQRWMFDSLHDPSLWFLAIEGDEIAGIALCRPHDTGDPEMGWVSVLGVRRRWRRRGLGLALLHHVFGEFHRLGRTRVGLGVDGASPTGATRLYERAGMSVDRRADIYEKPLRSG